MELSSRKIRRSLKILKNLKKDDRVIDGFLSLKDYNEKNVQSIFDYLSEKILDFDYTEDISTCFPEFLLLIVSTTCRLDDHESLLLYRRKCFVLSHLAKSSNDILRYAITYFKNKPPPFQESSPAQEHSKKKFKINESVDGLEINDLIVVKTCYNLLSCDPIFFKNHWDWSYFIENYCYKCSNDLQKIYCNYILSFLMNMTISHLEEMNNCISENVKIIFDNEVNKIVDGINTAGMNLKDDDDEKDDNEKIIHWNYPNDIFMNIEGVTLPIYNGQNAKFYKETDGNYDRIVKVRSTSNNLRSIALGILSGKAICLNGPVGSGKTTLIEYLARKTGRICPKKNEIIKHENTMINDKKQQNSFKEQNCNTSQKSKTNKRKSASSVEVEECKKVVNISHKEYTGEKGGFLRIQLGDQIDSKMILGQYRCTDVPGEFIWLPGVLTQAVMNGYWLLLEDLDSATQETCMILSNLLENNFLSVPGFRDHIKIESGFQLFFTIRTNQSSNTPQKATYSLLEKYLYTINTLPLSRLELCEIISTNYPKLATIANRIVDVFLTFSNSGNFRKDDNDNGREYTTLPFENITITNLPNSNRMVSTRDLMKLCERSNPMFSVTSTECAYFVFQNAVDVFCSYLPQGKEKTKLITSIGAKLGIIQSRCEFYSEEYKPDIKINDDDEAKIGRAVLKVRNNSNNIENTLEMNGNNEESFHVNKKMRLSDSKETVAAVRKMKQNAVTFSFTRISSCLLERIAVSITQNEPVLLVGETGVGKTSAIQYIAEKTNHKLIVVNMNNQSDVSDLVGGFKPVDLCYIMAPIRSEFEFLFRKTFNEIKNEKFLSNVSICYNQGNFIVLIKLMLRIVESVFKIQNLGSKIKGEYIERWKSLNIKLLKLNSQLNKSINISFAFIPGSLVNCIRNGDWVLLDEINLASAETLECLSTILEPDGSIVLLERGDLTPIKRHKDFRIFACMNPSTDIGKKDLPIGIRNRFTEFFVDELITDNDLMLLVNDYLSNTGIKKTKVSNIVKLYKKLKKLSLLELNDGLGNRPVFSLRTLCRALRICSKNLCGSIERNLYESFCLSFLTQLDTNSHKIVLTLIKDSLLTDIKAILSQPIPKLGENYLNFEGYWIQKGPKEIQECDYYILTDSVKQNLKDLCRIISIGHLPTLLQGPTSAGKTSLIEYIAKMSGNYCLRINNHEHTDLQEYIGTYTSDASGKLQFKEGVLVQAMRNGFWIILDELNLASTDILEALNRVLDDNRELYIPEIQKLIKAHPNFMLFATQNPPGLYGGRKTLSRAFKNRFIELHFNEIPKNELEIILEKRCLIPKSYSQKMVNCMSDLQTNRKTTVKNNFTLRDLFRWGNRYTYADKELLTDNSYDWNQHLVDEGYLVLSAKVRTDIELEIIEETLYKNFRKRISCKNLYSLHQHTSMVTKKILESLYNYKERNDIIWTENMTRMAVLTAKALQFNEPVLLVGPTGCGKTTLCQILSNINSKNLRILNCHMHTEGADFLGGLRPCRKNHSNIDNDDDDAKTKLFEWVDGPLVMSMKEGNYFMADEISLSEDSVLERLNSVLEPERTVLLAEKSDISTNNIDLDTLSKLSNEFVIKANDGFQFLATMNPGGDFGKKELSPALRNRFTEIWCKPSDNFDDLTLIAENFLKIGLKHKIINNSIDEIHKVAKILIEIVFYIKESVEKFKFSVRDILSWANYITTITLNNSTLKIPEIMILGLETLFLDSLEMIPHETLDNVEKIRNRIIDFSISKIKNVMKYNLDISEIENKRRIFLEKYPSLNISEGNDANLNFLFDAPTTKKNLFRLLSAMNLNKAILLEGPPGVGKTSIIENLCKAIGYKIVRINLCEHTDLADLFGTDLPAEEKIFDIDSSSPSSLTEENTSSSVVTAATKNLGKFTWRDGPLLSALKSENTWILLDELNLAPQNVLEGLNAILDHRGEVFIPELNKTFILNRNTRIFGCQNPLRQGGGRKGLPQSFLNRFIKVYLRKLSTNDLLFVIQRKYKKYFDRIHNYFMKYLKSVTHSMNKDSINLFNLKLEKNYLVEQNNDDESTINLEFDLAERMVKFSEKLDEGITDMEFGMKGGPFEINLRDILRWCNLLIDSNTGFIIDDNLNSTFNNLSHLEKSYNEFLLILYERMKLVYYQRMRCESDKLFIRNIFGQVFNCDAEKLNEISEDISLYWTNSKLYLNDIVIDREIIETGEKKGHDDDEDGKRIPPKIPLKKNSTPLMLTSQRELLKNMIECLYMEIPVILCGPTDSGKTKSVDVLCTIANQVYDTDTIDDSVTGGFQQIDFNRHLEEASNAVESVYLSTAQKLVTEIMLKQQKEKLNHLCNLMSIWKSNCDLTKTTYDDQNLTAMSDELILFKKRIDILFRIIEKLLSLDECKNAYEVYLRNIENVLNNLRTIIRNSETLNTGGHFEWIDSKFVQCLKYGKFICLEHVNLCSAAVLDRLNSVFEPNGTLLISEKGVTTTNSNNSTTDSEIIYKHKNFRAFLTLDPRNGELSRAMRNRCIELSLLKENYNKDDLKMIIHENGIHESYLMKCILQIHQNIKSLSDFSMFSISHLIHFSSLIASYKRIGYTDKKAIHVSGIEVYVNSSNTDLLGYGLEFYHEKLKQIIIDEIENLKKLKSIKSCSNNMENVILKCGNLNTISMIKLQCQPLSLILENFFGNNDQRSSLVKEFLVDTFSNFQRINFTINFDLMKFLIYILYESSTFNDVTLRNKYLHKCIRQTENRKNIKLTELHQLNGIFMNTIKDGQIRLISNDNDLPWNRRLFNRIRNYTQSNDYNENSELNLSACLIANLLIDNIPLYKVEKLNRISMIAYSQAITLDTISDTINNEFIHEISTFLMKSHSVIIDLLQNHHLKLNLIAYVDFIIALLWINRFHECSKNSILLNKKLNSNLFDKLLLHFKWIEKYFFNDLIKFDDHSITINREFRNCIKRMRNFVSNNTKPLDILKKYYYKKFIDFKPLYTQDQIKIQELKMRFDNLCNIFPHYGNLNKKLLLKKFQILVSDELNLLRHKILIASKSLSSHGKKDESDNSKVNDVHDGQNTYDDIENMLKEFENAILHLNEFHQHDDDEDDDRNDDHIKKNIPNEVTLNIIPFLEYFVVKSLIFVYTNENAVEQNSSTELIPKDNEADDNSLLNISYFENIPISNCLMMMDIAEIVNSKFNENYLNSKNSIMNQVKQILNVEEFGEYISSIPTTAETNYKSISTNIRLDYVTLQKYRLTNLSLRSSICFDFNCRNEFEPEIDYSGPLLTNSMVSLLFQNDGQFKQIPLSDLNVWKTTLKRINEIVWNNSQLLGKRLSNGRFDLQSSVDLSHKLLMEVKYLQKLSNDIDSGNFSSYNKGFMKLIEKLEIEKNKTIDVCLQFEKQQNSNSSFSNMDNWKITYYASMLHSLIGSIEICLLTYTPLIDPVEKNHLKNKYIHQDIEYLNRFKIVYDFMKIVMSYSNFGNEIYTQIENKIDELEKRKLKFQHKVALRPSQEQQQEGNLFTTLVQEIQHFCKTNCDPYTLLKLIENAEEYSKYGLNQEFYLIKNTEIDHILIKINDIIKKINLWIINSKKFLYHTLEKFTIYFNDFTKPIQCAILMFQYGLEGLKKSLIQLRNSYYELGNGNFKNFHENNRLCSVIENIGQFPNVAELKIFSNFSQKQKQLLKSTSSIFTILDRIDGSEFLYIQLLKAKLIEITNRLKITHEMNSNIFYEIDSILNICNKIWQEEEEKRKKRIAEEESLFTYKTRCETQNEEELELYEIETNFPTTIQEDFGEFIIEDTLEKVIKISKDDLKKSKNSDLIKDEDYKFIGKNFIYIMEHFACSYYFNPKFLKSSQNDLDFIEIFKLKLNAFIKLFNKYKSCLNDDCIDDTMYNSFAFTIGLQQQLVTKDSSIEIDVNSKSYNFYKDANVKEIISITEVVDRLEQRVLKQLDLYPDHAVLNDIIRIIKRIRNFSFTSPISRFNTGFQLLRQKVSQWNEVAHKLNHLRDLETEIAEYVQRWTKLELQFWRNCLAQTFEKVEANAYKYWFFIYNLTHEFLYDNPVDFTYTDFKTTEKRFEDENFYEVNATNSPTTTMSSIKIEDIIKVLKEFIESSNYGDFNIRMRLLRAFEYYLHYVDLENNSRKDSLISALHNIRLYFEQFSQEIDDIIKSIRTPIEKKLRDFVKIESYNKDLSYFSMRNNVAKVHRNLNKFLKEYENQLKEKIHKVFQQKENMNNEYMILNNDKGINLRHETKIKYYMLDNKYFIVSQKFNEQYLSSPLSSNMNDDNDVNHEMNLIKRVPKLFLTSRNIVKRIIQNIQYPNMISSLDSLLIEQIETCEYLRNLEIDRTQERPKQISQAKQILSQKRKSLSDLFKILSNLGLNFKSGLMELTLLTDTPQKKTSTESSSGCGELVNYEISPFDIKVMFVESKYKKKIDKNLIQLNENLNNYFVKCIFKLRLLKNVMQAPQSELGPQNIDRIKGFAIDMFILVQNQRKALSKTTKDLYDLRQLILNINAIQDCNRVASDSSHYHDENLNFSRSISQLNDLKLKFYKIRYVFEQFKLLLKNIPEEQHQENMIFSNNQNSIKTNFVKTNENYSQMITEINQILENVRQCLTETSKLNDVQFLNLNKITELENVYIEIVKNIENLQEKFEIKNGKDYLPISKPLIDLLENLKAENDTKDEIHNEAAMINHENIVIELENVIHSILLSLQKLFKKYSTNDDDSREENTKDDKITDEQNTEENEGNDENNEIHENHLKERINAELESDLKILNFSNILQKMQNILLTIKYANEMKQKNAHINKLSTILPLLEQYRSIGDYYLFQQLGAHKITTKMLSIMLTVFIELGSKGFCVPPDLMKDAEEGEGKKNEQKNDGGFGLEDGTGENDASDKIESEDQLEDAKRPEDRKDDEQKNEENCKEEKGIEMSEDFDGKMQDVEKPEDDESNDENDNEDELDKEMGETEEGAEKLDDQIWGSDEENEESEDEENMNEEDEGKGSKEESDQHNNLETKDDSKQGENEKNDGLDATNDDQNKKKQKDEIDNMKEPELDEDQVNPYHNELEEPPEAEDMDLGNFNIDEEAKDKDDEADNDNPFDIDKMKENMEIPEKEDENGENDASDDNENEENRNDENDASDSEQEPEAGNKPKDDVDENKTEEGEEEEKTEETTEIGNDTETIKEDKDEKDSEEEKKRGDDEEYNESKDKPTKDDKAQSIPQDKQKGSLDQVQTNEKSDIEQDEKMDEQDTGEEKDGVGQAENDTSEGGHQGISDTKQTQVNKNDNEKEDIKEKRKQGKTDEERTLGEADKKLVKQLKTIEKLKEQKHEEDDDDEMDETEVDEYQHVKEPKKTDKVTLDNATEEQSKQIQHLESEDEDENENGEDNENIENLELDEDEEMQEQKDEEIEEIVSEKTDKKSEKPSKSEKSKEKCETTEQIEIEGENIETDFVSRGNETSAHCIKQILTDQSLSQELTTAETLELRRMYQTQVFQQKSILPLSEDHDVWYTISNKMLPNARELCEQLRLILEPTKCTRLKGDYRTGRRINMKKIIPYIASQFRKDKIWLRRTKPAQRDYKITIAIDDSKSMHHNNSKMLTLEAISLVSQALTLLESGKLSIISFGESPKIILNHTEQFEGPKLVKSLNFSQNQSRIAELLDFVRTGNAEEGSSSTNGLFENLLLILSDGRNIYSEGEQKVKNSVKLARLQRIFLVYIIIDNPENKHSILDIRIPNFSADRKSITMKSYLDAFPFPYYVIVRDLGQLPLVLSEAMRQWFELVNSEQ